MAKKSQPQTKASKNQDKSIGALPILLFVSFHIVVSIFLFPQKLQEFLPGPLKKLFLSPSQTNLDTPAVYVNQDAVPESCDQHKYTTEIVSLDPLVIYINNFTSPQEAEELIKAGEEDFEDSFISRYTGNTKVSGRTSQSAPLEPDIPLVTCILARARTFMGSMLLPEEPFSVPQLVRYYAGKKYDLHTDFWPRHQVFNDGSGILFNRIASFFVFLRDNCTEGETYFPLVDVLDKDAEHGGGKLAASFNGKVSRGEKDGQAMGVKFKPIQGNAVFWVNMDAEGNGDRRLVHAGLPVGEGEKIGMNIWPRKFYGRQRD